MNWFEIVNKATAYIEENITTDIQLENIAKECHISYHYFSKIFSMLTGYGLKEYIRNRRITLASYEVSYSKEKIINIAFKYGYSSNESFSRAFKRVHGINPSVARKNKVMVYTHFPILQYKIPVQNLISLRYEMVENLEYVFSGKYANIIEKGKKLEQMIEHFKNLDEAFAKERRIKDLFRYKPTVYKVRYNIPTDITRYDYLIGFMKPKNACNDSSFQEINIKIKKGINFIARSITEDQIPEIKRIIYNEWELNQFEIDGVCEIEYTLINDIGKLDFFYIVSIK